MTDRERTSANKMALMVPRGEIMQPAIVRLVVTGKNEVAVDVRTFSENGKVLFGWTGPVSVSEVSTKVTDILNHIHADQTNVRDDLKAQKKETK